MIEAAAHMLFLMAAGHAIADRPLQDGKLREEKNAPRGIPGDNRWLFGIVCHGLIHGGFVAVITGLWWLGLAEAIAHASIDEAKCRGRFGLLTDQALHAACKLAWVALALWAA